ncbi:putative ATP-dependent RNA helicase DHX35, partial [Fragariocoptes setiger]
MDVEAGEHVVEDTLNRVYAGKSRIPLDVQRCRLPIFEHKDHILYLLENHQVLIIKGETGCGKSTQIPQYLLRYDWRPVDKSNDRLEQSKMICVTQPRRIAVTSLAARVSEELNDRLGRTAGYCVRFDECTTPGITRIKFVTEGILNRELVADPMLDQYNVVMIDEAHERNVNTDILMSLIKRVVDRRKEFRLIICSATLDVDTIYKYYSRDDHGQTIDQRVTVLAVEGHSYPTEIFYVTQPVPNYVSASVDTAIKIHEMNKISSGDILVYLTGQSEVIEACSMLVDYAKKIRDRLDLMRLSILPLYAALPSQEIAKIFDNCSRNTRKCIVATNIAETSLTIPGVAFVIDCGYVKLRFFNPKTSTDSLIRVPISQAAARQRAGRAGRTRKGSVYRLYTEKAFNESMKPMTPLEIQRCCLASVILQLKSAGVADLASFDMPNRMPKQNLTTSLELLFALGAIDIECRMTQHGFTMAEFHLEPQATRVLLDSSQLGCGCEAVIIVAMLQIKHIFVKPSNARDSVKAEKSHQKLSAKEGDLISYLNVYNSWLSNNCSKSWCDSNYISYTSLKSCKEFITRLECMMTKHGIIISSARGDVDRVLKAIVGGYFANSAYLHYSGNYRTIRGDHSLALHPTSILSYACEKPKYVTFTEVLHTTQEFIHNVTAIKQEWLYEIAPQYYHYGTK